jgi:hypothetical protein
MLTCIVVPKKHPPMSKKQPPTPLTEPPRTAYLLPPIGHHLISACLQQLTQSDFNPPLQLIKLHMFRSTHTKDDDPRLFASTLTTPTLWVTIPVLSENMVPRTRSRQNRSVKLSIMFHRQTIDLLFRANWNIGHPKLDIPTRVVRAF